MRRRLILLPGALETEGQSPLFERGCSPVGRISEQGRLFRIQSAAEGLSELDWLGLDPGLLAVEEGPLFVAALGAKPPERSVQFHLSVLSTDGRRVEPPGYLPTPQEAGVLSSSMRRLETSRLRIVEGHDLDHGLVWEDGSIELACQPPSRAEELGLSNARPEGDGEVMLRRFIDDSVNLLSELEFNEIRREEGQPPLNLLWPWGPGFAPRLPNLAAERGIGASYESACPRLAGLCRMSGYRHGDPWGVGRGTSLKLEKMVDSAANEPLWVGVIAEIGEFRAEGRDEEAAWMGREVAERMLEPMRLAGEIDPARLILIATDAGGAGLVLDYAGDAPPDDFPVPFRAEVAHDRRLATRPLHAVIAEALTP